MTDRYGFRNPDHLWDRKPIDLVIIGDSFAQGVCVDSPLSFPDLLRQHHPNTLNLGMTAHGPLLEFATLQEFADRLHPKTVVWVYFEGNDIQSELLGFWSDLDQERHHPILNRYLEQPTFRQALYTLSPEALTQRYEKVYTAPKPPTLYTSTLQPEISNPLLRRSQRLLTLYYLQKLLNARYQDKQPLQNPVKIQQLLAQFSQILKQSRLRVKTADQWLFVYIPAKETLLSNQSHPLYQPVLNIARQNGFDVVDMYDVLNAKPNALSYYPLLGDHFNEAGQALMAEQVNQRISVIPGM
ncbi:MAG: hypothetical protein KC474_08810 [Cyanobacteria bacterium HKST-UBA04]|nr:hypothetical protein [Cyanobacteria bacterium HKST-UBA04]